MSYSLLIICTLFSVIVAWIVVFRPLFLKPAEPYFGSKSESLAYQDALGILELLNDLENDYQMGKISSEDYQHLSLEYRHRYLEKVKEDNSH